MILSNSIKGLIILIKTYLAILILATGFAWSEEAQTPYPLVYDNLVDGEKLKYEAGWNGIPAANGDMVTRKLKGDIFHVEADAWTRGYVSWLWRMRDRIETKIDKSAFRPVKTSIKTDENRRVIHRTAEFFFDKGFVKIVRRKKDDRKEYEIPIGLTFDPISAAFLLRSIELKVGESPQIEVCEGKSVYLIRMDVVALEEVEIDLGAFLAYRMNVNIKKLFDDDDDKKKKKKFHWASLWLSADAARLPLKIESKVFIGNVYVELIEENRGLCRQPSPPESEAEK